MTTCIYEKTDKGREEIATRKHQVSPRLRALLVMIDGRQPLESLMEKFARLGFDKDCIDELVEQDYIRALPADEADEEPAPRPGAARVPPGLRRLHKLQAIGAAPPSVVAEPEAPAVALAAATAAVSEAERFQAVYRFYNETIRGNLGLRGFALQLKVEKAATLDDLRALRAPYLEGVLKAKGSETAQALDARLLALLNEGAID